MEKRVIVAKFIALVSVLIVSLLSIPFASAAVDFKILDDTLGQAHKILGMDAVVFGILVFLLFFLLYGIFALGLARSSLGSDNGRLNRNGKIIALSFAGVVVVSTFFVRTNVLAFAKNKLAPQFNMFFAVILSVLMFMLFRWMGKETFKDREDMANVFGIFAVGLALTMFGAIGAAKWAEGIGLTLIIISVIWLFVLMISGAGGDDNRNRPPPEPVPPPPHPPGRATIYGVVVDAATGNAIEGVQVSTTIDGQQYTSTSNRNGAYRLYSMPQSDNVIVHATANGYEDRDSEVINLTEDRRVDIPMGGGLPQVGVQVLNQDTDPFTPIQNDDTRFLLTVPGQPMPIEVPGEHVHPQGNGIYILALLADTPTPLTITAETPNYHLVHGANIPDLAHPPHRSEILMTAGSEANEIKVRVVDAAGARIISPATRLRMGLPGGTNNEIDPASIRDNGDGSYVIPETVLNPVLPLGGGTTLTLGARSPGHPDNDSAVNVDLAAIQSMYTIQLGGRGPTPPPPGTFSITGNVTDQDGNPLPGARVELNAAHHADSEPTPNIGQYTILDIPNAEAGNKQITISCAGYQTKRVRVGLNPNGPNTHNFQINRYTFRIHWHDATTNRLWRTFDTPYNLPRIGPPPGDYMVRIEADPNNGRLDVGVVPPAERLFELNIPGQAQQTINITIQNENNAELEHHFSISGNVAGVRYAVVISMVDRPI